MHAEGKVMSRKGFKFKKIKDTVQSNDQEVVSACKVSISLFYEEPVRKGPIESANIKAILNPVAMHLSTI